MNTSQKQEFIGGLVASVLVKKGVEFAVEKGLEKAAKKPSTKMAPSDVPKAAPAVVDELKKEVQAQAEHKLDAEPHWQSRNIWGSFVGLICAADVIYKMWTDDVTNDVMDYITQIGLIMSILTPLYSRFIAKKPLFR